MRLLQAMLFTLLLVIGMPSLSQAEDKSFYSPVIYIDVENHRILISQLGGVFYIDVPDIARPHMEKLPVSGLVDFVVDWKGDEHMPVIKTWKVKSGESTCMYFNGKECK
ncbi:MAG: hypothetical protein Nkreftii_001620 [Candidatus Nitrospira kreftii]|uniref:Uncharacterized protein n=1 Tax=Candidatus Nitrospira kreftii TaxID=2652173 RepID=A0A7S8FDS8_9BACT|nr:MAG: hypothetical protein Nkreftii_001620 [Candidatus Nitrospira kreftii]